MGTPQDNELRRSGRGEIDPESRHVTREGDDKPKVAGRRGKVPPRNRPGRRPKREQDKPHPAP